MTDTQHTPGDWEAAKAYPVDKNLYCAMVHAPVKTGKAHTPRVAEALGLTPEEAKANATLIATAPKLLKACKLLLTGMQDGSNKGFKEGLEAINAASA